jgi:hypothetical protein
VALRRITVPDDRGIRDAVRRRLALLSGIEHPHLVRLHGVVTTADSVVLVLDRVPGGSLARRLADRGRLQPGQVVTLALPLAQALAAAHACGVVHGRVTPSAVLFATDGRPLLSDLGMSGLVAADTDAPGVADDVQGLAATCWWALVGTPAYDDAGARRRADVPLGAERLAAVLEPALGPDPARRPTLDALAASLWATAGVRSLRPAEPTRRLPPRSHRAPARRRRRGMAAISAIAAVALLVGIGLHSHLPRDRDQGQRSEPWSSPGGPATTTRWSAVLASLDRHRAQAFASASPRQLTAVYAPGSPAMVRDRSRLAEVAQSGLRVQGLRLRTRSVEVRRRAANRVVLRVVDILDAYALRAPDGSVVERRPARGPRTWSVTLVRAGDGWRIYDVVES